MAIPYGEPGRDTRSSCFGSGRAAVDEDGVAARVRHVEAVLGTGPPRGSGPRRRPCGPATPACPRRRPPWSAPRTPTTPTRPSSVTATPPGLKGVCISSVSRPSSTIDAVLPFSLATKIRPFGAAAAAWGKSPTGVSLVIFPSGKPTCTRESEPSAGTSTGRREPARSRCLADSGSFDLSHRLPALAVDQRELVGVTEGHRDQPGPGIGRYPFRRGAHLDHLAGGLLLQRRRLGRLRSRRRFLVLGILFGSAT